MRQPVDQAIFVVPDGRYGTDDINPHVFLPERDRAFAADTPTSMILLCRRESLGVAWPATTPVMLGRYLRIRAGEQLSHTLRSTAEIYHVIQGSGGTLSGSHELAWSEGDSFALGGGTDTTHRATGEAILFQVTNEPELCYLRSKPSHEDLSDVTPIMFTAGKLDESLLVIERAIGRTLPKAVMMVNQRHQLQLGATPSLSVAYNTLPPDQDQLPHRHSAAALTLCLVAEGMYSLVDGVRVDWSNGAVFITPPNAVHSHHNRGLKTMRSFVVQDGSLHAQLRTTNLVFGG